jgi:L-lactate dehydrogenase complex protein LldF
VCPVAINIPEALVHLRAEVVDAKRSSPFQAERMVMGVTAWILRSGLRLGLAQRAASASRVLIGRSGRIRRLPPPLSAWTKTRDLPVPPPESFRAWWARTHGGGP